MTNVSVAKATNGGTVVQVRDLINSNVIAEFESGGFEIIADDGKALFTLRVSVSGDLEVRAVNHCKHSAGFLSERLNVCPIAVNDIVIKRAIFEGAS